MLSVKKCDIFKCQKNIAQSKKILLKENITDNCKIQKKKQKKNVNIFLYRILK